LKNFTLSLNEARKAHYFFSATHSTFCCSAKIKQGYFAKHQKLFLL